MGSKTVSDAGPIIHLSEIDMSRCFSIFRKICVPREVYNEVRTGNLPGNDEIESNIFEILDLKSSQKDRCMYFSQKYQISIADGAVITLAKDMGIDTVLTDDLEVRDIVKSYGMRPVGSIGVLLRAYREKSITYKEAVKALENLLEKSSLYITSRLVENAKSALKEYDLSDGHNP